jgi:hypothetical protein
LTTGSSDGPRGGCKTLDGGDMGGLNRGPASM